MDRDDLIMEDYCSHLLSIIGDADIAVAGAAAVVVVGEAAAASVLVMLFSLNNKISFRVALY